MCDRHRGDRPGSGGDGRSHVQAFTVDKSEYGCGALRAGQACVQLCMTTGGEESPAVVAYSSHWVVVR